MPCLNKTDIKKELQELLNIPVTIDNDATCASYAELWLGNLKDINTGLLIVLGSGVGGSIIINQQIHNGKNNKAGEIGGLLVDFNKDTMTARSFGRKNSSVWLINDVIAALDLDEETSGEEVFELIKNGNKIANEYFINYCFNITELIFNLDYTLDLEVVCIGGGVSNQEILIETINDCFLRLREKFEPDDQFFPKIKACKFSNDANLIGALYYFLKENK